MSLLINDNMVVSIHYKLTDDDGNVLDSTEGSEPLSYLQGAGKIIPGLEKALVGKAKGDSLQVKVDPANGYGEVMPDFIHTVDKSALKGVDSVKVGMIFEAQGPNGSVKRIVVKKVDDDKVTIDGNHPLAGVTLNFDVEIVDVKEKGIQEAKQQIS